VLRLFAHGRWRDYKSKELFLQTHFFLLFSLLYFPFEGEAGVALFLISASIFYL
jgi:hypothetical protein